MTDHYISFSEGIDLGTEEECAWWRKRLNLLEDLESNCMQRTRLLERYEMDNGDSLQFEWVLGSNRIVFFSRESWGDPRQLARIIQDFLATLSESQCFSIRYACVSSPLRPSDTSGGAIFVTRDAIQEFDTASWLRDRYSEWDARSS